MNTAQIIESQAHAFVEAFNARDAKKLAALFTEDAVFVNIIAVRTQGRAAIEAGHATHFAGALARNRLAYTEVMVKPLSTDTALCQALWSREALPGGESGGLPPGNGILTFVAVKRDDHWLFASAQNTESRALPVQKG